MHAPAETPEQVQERMAKAADLEPGECYFHGSFEALPTAGWHAGQVCNGFDIRLRRLNAIVNLMVRFNAREFEYAHVWELGDTIEREVRGLRVPRSARAPQPRRAVDAGRCAMRPARSAFQRTVRDLVGYPPSLSFCDLIDQSQELTALLGEAFDKSGAGDRFYEVHTAAAAVLRNHASDAVPRELEQLDLQREASRLDEAYRLGLAVGRLRALATVSDACDLVKMQADAEGDHADRR